MKYIASRIRREWTLIVLICVSGCATIDHYQLTKLPSTALLSPAELEAEISEGRISIQDTVWVAGFATEVRKEQMILIVDNKVRMDLADTEAYQIADSSWPAVGDMVVIKSIYKSRKTIGGTSYICLNRGGLTREELLDKSDNMYQLLQDFRKDHGLPLTDPSQ